MRSTERYYFDLNTYKVEGLQQGAVCKLIQMVVKKLCKGKSPELIAEELEEEPEQIAHICKVAEAYAPEYDCESIYHALSD